jgi:tight adherence protein B
MVLFEYPIIALFFTISLSLLAYQAVVSIKQFMHKYKATYIESVELSLKDLFLLFNPEDVFTISITLAIVFGLLSYVLIGNILLAITFMLMGFFLPKVYLSKTKKKRIELLGIQLVDGLTLISNALRAGQSLPQSLSLLVKEMPPPISQEFGILTKEYELGVPIETCLSNLANRVKSNELELFVNSILICGQTGGNLTETFDNITLVIRERIRLEGKIDSMTAEGRTQGMVLTLMPLFLGLAFYWIEPELIKLLFTTVVGNIILALVIGLDIGAWFITKKIVNIDI